MNYSVYLEAYHFDTTKIIITPINNRKYTLERIRAIMERIFFLCVLFKSIMDNIKLPIMKKITINGVIAPNILENASNRKTDTSKR